MGNLTAPLEVHNADKQERIRAAIARLRDLPASAPVVSKALRQLDNPDYQMGEVKKTLMSDQAVTARILRLANSAYFGFRSEVQTLSQAVVLLGQQRIRTLLQRILVDKIWLDLGHGQSAAAPLRSTSLTTATASCTLSQLLDREDAEEMLLAGLLHNIGDLLLLTQFPQESELLNQAGSVEKRAQAAAEMFGMSAGRAGRLLLDSWHFPPLYGWVAEHCENPLSPECPPQAAAKVALVYVAKQLATASMSGLGVEEAVSGVSAEVCGHFEMEADLLAEVYQGLPERTSLEQLQAAR